MSGICGSYAPTTPADEAAEIMAAMASGLVLTDHVGSASAGRCLAAASGAAIATDATEPVWSAIDGRPRWRTQRFADIAAREDHAAALIAAYREFGREAFAHLSGAWAAAIIDTESGTGLIAVDRVGLRPMCYACSSDGGLVFGTTVDSVRHHPSVVAEIDPQSIYSLLHLTRIPAPDTIYADIAKLGPGQVVEYRAGKAAISQYWKLDYRQKSAADAESLASELRNIMRDAVARCLEGVDPDKVGAFLSGGVDSTTVTGYLAELSPTPPKAFTVGFDAAGYDEMEFASAAAKHYGVDHRHRYVSPADIIEFLPRMAQMYDEPYANGSAVPAFYCAQQASEAGVQVMLAGDGGDELFAGNERYVTQRLFERYFMIPAILRRNLIEPIVSLLPLDGPQILRLPRSYVRRCNIPLPDRLESYNHFGDIPASECFMPEVAKRVDTDRPLATMRTHYRNPDDASTLDRMMYLDMQTTIADDDIRKVNRTAEASGVEVRYPLLDEEVVEFSTRLPEALQLRHGKLRWFFKHAMREMLPQSTLTKSKHGFGLPFDLWIRTDPALRDFSYGKLADLGKRGIFRPDFVDETVAAHRRNDTHSHGDLVWAMLLLELWFESRHDQPATATPVASVRHT